MSADGEGYWCSSVHTEDHYRLSPGVWMDFTAFSIVFRALDKREYLMIIKR